MADTVIKRIGGKVKLRKWIHQHLPSHKIYCEPFSGSFAVGMMFCPPRNNKTIVFNDLDSHLWNLFRVMRDHRDRFIYSVKNTPYSREEFNRSYDLITQTENWDEVDPVEWARCYLIYNRQSFSGKEDGSWCISKNGENIAATWASLDSLLDSTSKKLQGVYLENSSYEDIFRRWDSDKTLFYIDPPYEGVEQNYYTVNKKLGFSHAEMADRILKLQGSVVVSYYYSDYISSLLPGFKVHKKAVKKHLQTSESKSNAIEALYIKDNNCSKSSIDIFS